MATNSSKAVHLLVPMLRAFRRARFRPNHNGVPSLFQPHFRQPTRRMEVPRRHGGLAIAQRQLTSLPIAREGGTML